MNNRTVSSLTVILLLSGCSQSGDEVSSYGRDSLKRLDENCIKRSVEAQMQQAADYSAARLNALGNRATAPESAEAGYPDIQSGMLDDCMQETGNGR